MKKGQKTFYIVILIACMLIGYGFSHVRVDDYRADITYKLHAAAVPIPTELIVALAGEFKGLVADYLLLEAASFNGSRQSFQANPEDWDSVARLLQQSNALDPYFRSTYFLAHSTLPWRAHKYDENVAILENSKKHLTWDWYPGFFLGFTYFYFLKDKLTASKELMEASKIPGAPFSLATMASRLAAEAGQIAAAIDFLTVMYENSEDDNARNQLRDRILALHGIQIIQDAVRRFQSRYGRIPDNLDELVSSSILPALPVNPYHRPYRLKDGRIYY